MPHKGVLITRPNYDATTYYLSIWSRDIIKIAKQRDMDVIDLYNDKANREELVERIRKKKPKLIVFNGHGSNKEIYGQKRENEEILIKSGVNHHLLKSKIVYSRTCSTAGELGQKCIDSGTIAYIGYSQAFIFPFDKSKTTRPLQDEMAKPILESSNIIPIALIKGNNVKESDERSKKAFQKRIEYYKTHYFLPEAQTIMFCLRWNMVFQESLGEKEATI